MNVSSVPQENLCISCGICKGVCGKQAIQYRRQRGMYYPVVNKETCNNCGMCYKVCPGKGTDYTPWVKDSLFGQYTQLCNAWSRDDKIRFTSTSGGVVTSMVKALLESGEYDCAYLVASYNHEKQTGVECVTADNLDGHAKSRYVAISQEKAVDAMLHHKETRIIFVGTSCACQGIRHVIEMYHLEPSQYLLIGLFCASIMNYNVWHYFSKLSGKELTVMHFRDKESGNWPGNMKMMYADGSYQYIDRKERMQVKEYFKPERCLYCIDKLNVSADISLGDNYTKENDPPEGSNTVIIRTVVGEKVWDTVKDKFECYPVSEEAVTRAQELPQRVAQLSYAKYKERKIGHTINEGVPEVPKKLSNKSYNFKRLMSHGGAVRILSNPTCFKIVRKICGAIRRVF